MSRNIVLLAAVALGVLIGYLSRDRGNPDSTPITTPVPAPERPRASRRVILETELDPSTHDWLHSIRELAAKDPQKALAKLALAADAEALPLAFAALARGWAEHDPEAAAAWVAGLESSDDQVSAATGLIPAWCDRDPGQCLDWTRALPPGNLREVSLTELADAWAGKSALEAFDVFLALPAEAGVKRGLHAVVSDWALADPQGALRRISQVSESDARRGYLELALVSLCNENPQLAWQEAGTLPDFPRATHVRGVALEALAETRPHDALGLATAAGSPPEFLTAVARGWAMADAEAATRWAETQTDESLRQSLRDEIGRVTQADP